jgi:ribose-phosphate pyrophosphokinase
VRLLLLGGSAHPSLCKRVARELGVEPARRTIERFPDGELHVGIEESVRGCDVHLLQPTCAPVDANLFELLLLGDACARAGAVRITALIPCFGYARQDRRTNGREPLSARVAADALRAGSIDRVVAVDLHSAALEGFFPVPVEHLTALPLLAAALRAELPADGVIVAPDLGAAKLAHGFAGLLELPAAVVHKARLGPEEVTVHAVAGEVRGRAPILVDDMLSTGATVEAAVRALLDQGARPEATIAATHGLFAGSAARRLRELPLRRCLVTDSVPPPAALLARVEVVGLAPLLAEAIRRLHAEEPLDELLGHG